MNKILVAVDSFKGSMTSLEAGKAIERGIKSVIPDSQVRVRPVADGGEGTVDALIYGRCEIRTENCEVTGPLGAQINAEYRIYSSDGIRTAVMEMAAAAGLPLVPDDRRNPMHTTTCGVGEMIRDAVIKGCTRFIIGIGGSATNDGGIGMLQALGFSCLDETGKDVPHGAEGLGKLACIRYNDAVGGKNVTDLNGEVEFARKLSDCTFRVVCDVTNPLVGELGCSKVFAAQKGADAEMISAMEQYMTRYADIAEADETRESVNNVYGSPRKEHVDRYTPGTGAAGGLGYAFLMFLDAELLPGIEIVLEETKIEKDISWADTVITGEGRIDGQTLMGKTPAGVAGLAKKHGKYVVAIGGCLGEDADKCVKEGLFDECYSVNNVLKIDASDPKQQVEAVEHDTAESNLEKCTARILEIKKKMVGRVCRPARIK